MWSSPRALGFGVAPVSARLASRHCPHVLRRVSRSASSASSFLAVEEERIARHAAVWAARPRQSPRPHARLGRAAMEQLPLQQQQQQQSAAPGAASAAAAARCSGEGALLAEEGAAALPLPRPRTRAALLDGAATAAAVKDELAAEVAALAAARGGARPGLAVVIVGERRDSQTYVRAKHRACEDVGITSLAFELPVDCGQDRLVQLIDDLNAREDVHGILVQLPLPDGFDNETVLGRIAIEKDVDGFHPLNIGRLCMSGRTPPLFVPCTPKGCIELLDRYHVPIEGKHAVVVGRSNIVGLPVAMLLLHRNATVTICHSRTVDLAGKLRSADIVVAACGRANFVKGEWLKQGAVVIDVGINAVDDATKKRGYRLVGDVEFEAACDSAALITPVPGGVGPMTIAMLLSNTVGAAKRSWGVTESEQKQA